MSAYSRFWGVMLGCILVVLLMASCGQGEEPLFVIAQKIAPNRIGLRGYMNRAGDVVLDFQFELAHEFSQGLASVEVGGKWGFIDRAGKFVINPRFDWAASFSEGLAQVKLGDKFGFIDSTGQMAIAPQFEEEARPFTDGYAVVKKKNNYSYIDKRGALQGSSPEFTTAYPFSDGLASVKTLDTNRAGYIDQTFQFVIEPQFDWAYPFSEGLAAVQSGQPRRYGYIDTTGGFVIKPEFSDAGEFSEGLAFVRVGNKYGFIDKTGSIVIIPRFDETHSFSEGLAAVQVGGKYGFIDHSGKFVIPPEIDGLTTPSDFKNGLARVTLKSKGVAWIDKGGKIVWPTTEATPSSFTLTIETFRSKLRTAQGDDLLGYHGLRDASSAQEVVDSFGSPFRTEEIPGSTLMPQTRKVYSYKAQDEFGNASEILLTFASNWAKPSNRVTRGHILADQLVGAGTPMGSRSFMSR